MLRRKPGRKRGAKMGWHERMRGVVLGALAACAVASAGAAATADPPPRVAQAVPAADAPPAVCAGADLMQSLPAETRARIDAAVAATPYAQGTRFTARKGDARIEIIGTYHFDDPRHDPMVAALTPVIASADAMLVEAGPDEEKRLTVALARDPSLMVDTEGPTLPERLGDAAWRELGEAMSARGMPPVMVSRLRPWYVSMMLGISPCMMGQIKARGDTAGLDHRLMQVAADAGVPVRALEPWDTVLTLFDGMSDAEELDMIRAALPAARLADDYATTTIEAYFRGDIWAIWEFGRLDAYDHAGMDRASVDRQVQLAEDRLMTGRNRGWIAPLTEAATAAAARGKPVVAAFGALHLPGEDGVLRLLERDGWTITAGGAS